MFDYNSNTKKNSQNVQAAQGKQFEKEMGKTWKK